MEVILKLFGTPATKCVIGSAVFCFEAHELWDELKRRLERWVAKRSLESTFIALFGRDAHKIDTDSLTSDTIQVSR